jgi:chemotaxis protein MotB
LAEEHHPEIVIVRRHARHVDEHHGGAWKIAFADFMTAMMALFLVLWLISSTSDKERRAVAQYFNPVKLVDMTTLEKGFHEPKDTEMGPGPEAEPLPKPQKAPVSAGTVSQPPEKPSRETKHAAPANPPSATAQDGKPRRGGTEKRPDREAPAPRTGARPADSAPSSLVAAFSDPFATIPDLPLPMAEAEPGDSPDAFFAAPPGATAMGQAARAKPEGRVADSEAAAEGTDLETLAAEIRDSAKSATDKQSAPKVEVRATAEGVLVSLTDDVDDTMFAIGSAEPDQRTIEVLKKVASSLSAREGTIVIRGHTDSRPYHSGGSDNWRLSTARAHAARDILVRGGFPESRIERIEGHADRTLRVPTNPTAPENRRIEILLRKERG